MTIQQIYLPVAGIELLQAEARGEGYNFIERLVDDWLTGEVRFDQPGEMLCGCIEGGLIVAVGGITRDPFAEAKDVGRIRRVYVRAAWRNKGIGAALVTALTENARKSFGVVRLRAENATAVRLYERIGFSPTSGPHATHVLEFR